MHDLNAEAWEELAEIAASLEALLAWEQGCGATVLPPGGAAAAEAAFGPPLDLRPAREAPGRGPAPRPARPDAPAPPSAGAPAPRERAPAVHPAPAAPSAPAAPVNLPGRWAVLATAPPPASALPEPPAARGDPADADSLATLRATLGDCTRCRLCDGRKNIVFGVGTPRPALMVIGEGPGEQEDLKGEPFVGPAGELLDRMLANVLNLKREDVYIANVVKCRPPKNRDPAQDEIATCRPFLDQQIRLLKPKVILVLGRIAAQALIDPGRGINALRGRWHDREGVPVMATFHPAYLLRKEASGDTSDKRKTWTDLLAVKTRLAQGG